VKATWQVMISGGKGPGRQALLSWSTPALVRGLDGGASQLWAGRGAP
jgi:hypothetical protein